MHSMLYISILLILDISISNAFNAIYLNTVDTRTQVFLMHSMPCMLKQSIHSLHNIHVMVCMPMQSTQSNYNVDSSTKSSNYIKVQLQALNYFELQETSK